MVERALEFSHCLDKPLQVLRAGEAMVAILDQRKHNVVLRETRGELDSVIPRYVRVLHALQNAHWAAGLDHAAEQKMIASLLDQTARDRIGLAIVRRSVPDPPLLNL